MADPNVRKAMSKRQREAWLREDTQLGTKEWRQKVSEGMKRVLANPKMRQRISNSVKVAWARGDFDNRDRTFYDDSFGEARKGCSNPNWRGGTSFEPYSSEFNSAFKDMIKRRDNHTCAICKLSGRNIHHIDYNKDNTMPENCITLCRSCHGVTGGNREYWQRELAKLVVFRKHLGNIECYTI